SRRRRDCPHTVLVEGDGEEPPFDGDPKARSPKSSRGGEDRGQQGLAMRGRGPDPYSPAPKDYTFAAWTADLRALCDHLAPGVSFGGLSCFRTLEKPCTRVLPEP